MNNQKNLRKCKCNIFMITQFVVLSLLLFKFASTSMNTGSSSCNKSRKIFKNKTFGEISHGVNSNYTQDSHCEWLIKADNDSQIINLKFLSLKTECSYDYIFIYDGNSYKSQLIGSFSGQSEPEDIVAVSGYMLILFYSDTNYVLDGFRAEFTITNCWKNCSDHGICLNHSCLCTGDWIGQDCSMKACDCGDEESRGHCNKDRCECLDNFSGQTCSLHKTLPETSQWHWLTNTSNSFSPRAAHTAIYYEATDSVYIFGGYNLNHVIGSLEIFKFKTSTWEDEHGNVISKSNSFNDKEKSALLDVLLDDNIEKKRNLGVLNQFWFKAALLSHTQTSFKPEMRVMKKIDKGNSTRPNPRYGHAACLINDSFVIYGGKTMNNELSNELWMYNISTNSWSIRAQKSLLIPPKLVRHSLTYVSSNGFIYLFGGENEEFSSQMFRIKLSSGIFQDEQWERVHIRGGKSFDYRVVAHTTNYHQATNSLIVYGGIVASVARLSKLSDRIFSFDLMNQHWTEIFYPKTILREMSIPRERAFHSSTIAGKYLIVFGGYSHRHNKEEICYDNQMYFYHIECHVWINQEALGANRTNYPKKQGVFAHSAVLREDNTLLILGGYHGTVNNDFLAFTLPDLMISSKNLTNSEKCFAYKSSTECIASPECGWCSSDATCYGRTTVSNCFTNLQTTRCPGICSTLKDCQSCLIHGGSENESKKGTQLSNGKCVWCVQNAKCHQKNDYEPCGESDSIEKIGYQWWGRNGVEIDDKSQCTKLDKPPGLMYLKYFHPFNWEVPDFVSLVNSTLIDFSGSIITSQSESSQNGDVVTKLRGFLHLPPSEKDQKEMLKVCGSYAQIVLKASTNSESILVANFTAEQNHCMDYIWKFDLRKLAIDLQARRKLSNQITQQHYQSKVGLQNNLTKAFTFEFLEPFSNGSCSQYNNCLYCLTDNDCGWCDLKSQCLSRNINETSECRSGDDWRYLILQPDQCVNCSNMISCEACTSSSNCEWWLDETKCVRAGRSPSGITKVNECPSPCYQRNNCSSCLHEKGRCVWCEEKSTCFSFAVYISEYQFGMCREWIDQSLSAPYSETSKSLDNQCKSCSALSNCSTCLKSLNCGWCYHKNNPIEGTCIQGDFNNSMTCNDALNSDEPTLYNYESCPDVDECLLDIHECHNNAQCSNTHGSYFCKCNKGFIGDGKQKCDKTCVETCHHGRCSNYPDFTCICDLGWTGDDCSINCGCNNHSKCNNIGPGVCDECQEYTEGENCEKCIVGSYGNAITTGCKLCNCNDHADETLGQCDQNTGKCFCLDNTEGMNCDLCAKNYYGSPLNGGQCFLQCQSRAVLKTLRKQGIGSAEVLDGTKECLWILKLNESIVEGSLIRLQIEERDMNVSCYNNAIYIYNSIPEFPRSMMEKKLSSVVCRDSNFPEVIEESKSGQMTIFFRRGENNEGFNAVISVFSCHLGTCSYPYECNANKSCVCPIGFRGLNCEIEICPFNCSFSLKQGQCDLLNNRCYCKQGFGGEDCSQIVRQSSIVISELFNTQLVSDNFNHLKKTLPRFGHTVNVDRRGFLWVFGGYSLANGALNDIRQFDTKNHTWMQVTVDGAGAKMPVGRYFHASEVIKQSIYIYGGLANNVSLLKDFWMFNIQDQSWIEIEGEETNERPGFLSGHSLTLVKIGDRESFLMIGGYSNETNSLSYSIAWEYSFVKSWTRLCGSGFGPTAIFGHSAVYHVSSQVVYVYGGYQVINSQLQVSRKLYSLSYQKKNESWSWSILPVFRELNRPEENLPRSRYFHSAISFSQFMIIYGGESQPFNSSDYLNAYVYKCNSWVRLTENVEIIGKLSEKRTFGSQAVTSVEGDVESNILYIVGGLDSLFSISKVSIPADICKLWSFSKYLCRLSRGCSFGTITANNTRNTFCFSSDQKENRKNEVSSAFNHGLVCNDRLLAQRNCSSFTSCGECEAIWPNEQVSSCRWCKEENCSKSHKQCTSNESSDEKIINKTTAGAESCPNTNCLSIDCENCKSKTGCLWSIDSSTCVSSKNIEKESIEDFECPAKCSFYNDCSACLSADTSEGGFDHCVWSTKMNRCLSPSYKSLICSGANCGLLISSNDTNQCPKSCESYTMCSKCLMNTNCGWCMLDKSLESGKGICIEGNLDTPLSDSIDRGANSVCKMNFELITKTTTNETFEWNFLKCPPENECLNSHHTCNNKTEKCVDLNQGFRCECADGYQSAEDINNCLPICQSCIHGECVEPDVCKCNFGYVGNNCSIQCLCSGHSNCAGPDKLDDCLECKNNTIGKQCEKCDKFFVGDPKNNGECVSCLNYCNGHSNTCVAELSESFMNLSRIELEAVLSEGARANAICLNCANDTDGQRCETCLTGFFRGTTNLNDGCRKCQCNGHGDVCDPVTGEKCNCGDNSENDNTCPAKLDKNSIYHCWSGCSKCKESYSGHPKNGHQCYKHITIDSKMCLDAKPLDECREAPIPLQKGKTVFFVVQPRFMNVDIRIILDVTQGELDFFMSSNDDSFVVLTNHSNGFHEILLDSKYKWLQEIDSEFDQIKTLNVTSSNKKSFENVSTGFSDDGATDCRSFGKFQVIEKTAQSLSTHITLSQCNTLLRVRSLKNRLVVTLPQNIHNLSGTRFFIALRSANYATVVGLLFFRQDQLHIDLFVFFSVFFSCFFLFLSACVVFWKAKQASDMRRARRRHVVEMLNMAQRPYSSMFIEVSDDSSLDKPLERKTTNRSRSQNLKRDCNYVPVAVETTANNLAAVCTVFIQLPGQKRTLVCLGSSLILQPKNNMFLNKAPSRISQQVV